MAAHISQRTYFVVFLALLGLTAFTVAVAFLNLGDLNNVLALGIAVTKALLVMTYFMHLRNSPALTRMCVAAGVAWLAMMIVLTMSDFATRGWIDGR
jgi:cytochrome c oxidase subunit 4